MRKSSPYVAVLCLLAAVSSGCCGHHGFSTCHLGGCNSDYSASYATEHFDDWDHDPHGGHGADCGCDECGGGGCDSCGDCDSCGGCGHHLFPIHHWGCRPHGWAHSCGCLFGWGCGDAYICDYVSDPPACCEPCDDCGHWIGPSSAKPCGSRCNHCGDGHPGAVEEHYSPDETFVDDEVYYGASSRQPSKVRNASGRNTSGRTVTRATHASNGNEANQVISAGRGRQTARTADPQPTRVSRSTFNRQSVAPPTQNDRVSGSRVAKLGTKQ